MTYEQSKDLLFSLGFEIYDENNDNHVWGVIDVDDDEVLFIEKDFSRNRIFVKIEKEDFGDFFVYVMNDIGCGSVLIPFRWGKLSSNWLTHLKMALHLTDFKR